MLRFAIGVSRGATFGEPVVAPVRHHERVTDPTPEELEQLARRSPCPVCSGECDKLDVVAALRRLADIDKPHSVTRRTAVEIERTTSRRDLKSGDGG